MLSLAMNPPTILISIDIMSRLADIIAKTNRFLPALLADDQQDVANAFAGGQEPEQRFGVGQWSHWPSGHPMLFGARLRGFD